MEAPDPIPISVIEHWSYCPRQCALIHMEQSFNENHHTLHGRALHATVDTPGYEIRAGIRAERALPIWSDTLGLVGRADIVEFQADGTPYPVEYKHGPKRQRTHDDLQLAAQALCLEEMTGKPVPKGAIFHASSKRRREVLIDAALKTALATTLAAIRDCLDAGQLPPPIHDARCRGCSLIELCQPEAMAAPEKLKQLAARLFDPAPDA
ncbi:MAG: hypothetical protein RL695_1353 [Pseudomonadota bacterium]